MEEQVHSWIQSLATILAACVGALMFACVIQLPVHPPSVDPTIYDLDCRILYRQELGREVDPSGLSACESRLAARRTDGMPVETQEDFRAWLRTTPEWAERQERLRDVVLPRLIPRGQFLGLETGERFTVIGASGFTLYQQFLDGGPDAIEAVLAQLEELGFNTVRVFGMYNNAPNPTVSDPGRGGIGRFIPSLYGETYWTALPAFYQRLAKHGLYGEFTVFADTSQILTKQSQLSHWDNVLVAFQGITNAWLDAVNEADQPINRTDALEQLRRPEGVLASHGSNGSQAWPVSPYWDVATFHTNEAPEERRKVGHNAMEIWNGPTVTDEISRSPVKGDWPALGGQMGYDMARASTLLNAGFVFHSSEGKYGQLLTEPSLSHARAMVAGARSIPLDCQDGPYRHRQDLEGTMYLRVYQRGDRLECLTQIR